VHNPNLCAFGAKGFKKVFSELWWYLTFKIQKVDFKGSKTELSLMVRLTIKLKSENLGKGGPHGRFSKKWILRQNGFMLD
jgi:hypothetical protein